MKVGLLTFVCAQNWGAVLQGYSTQEFINNNTSHECEVLNWEPVDNSLLKPYKTIPNLLHYASLLFYEIRLYHGYCLYNIFVYMEI